MPSYWDFLSRTEHRGSDANYGLGATTTRISSSGISRSCAIVTAGLNDLNNASNSAVTGAPSGRFKSSAEIFLATTVIPHGYPRTDIADGCIRHGPAEAAFSSIGAHAASQFAVFKKEPINCATHEQSLHSLTYNTWTFRDGTPFNLSKNESISRFLGCLYFSSANSASFVRAVESAILFSVSNLYRSKSSLDADISCLCNLTTAHVENPAISANIAAKISDPNHPVFPTVERQTKHSPTSF
jgi:hypothetical protein